MGSGKWYLPRMSTAVLEMKSKVEHLTPEERRELQEFLEDIEDNALAGEAKAEGGPLVARDALKRKCQPGFRARPRALLHRV